MKKETAYQRRGCSIFCKILHSLLLVLLAEMLLLIFAISTSRVTSQLNENAEDILDKQVENRANYLRQNLIQAQDLNAISGTIGPRDAGTGGPGHRGSEHAGYLQ